MEDIIMIIIVVYYLLVIIAYLLKAWGLYMINKKLGEPYPWLAWIPLLQVYSYLKASWKPMKEYLLYPILIMIWIMAIATVLWIIWVPDWVAAIVWIWAWLYILVVIIKITHWISIRTWGWVWTTVWLMLIWFIMFPIVGYKLDNKSNIKIKPERKLKKEVREEL